MAAHVAVSKHLPFTPIKHVTYTKSDLIITIDDRIRISVSTDTDVDSEIVQGTVKFIGHLHNKLDAPLSEHYYGIELDSAAGKNEGKYNKVEYFRCGPRKGLFVKRARILSMERPNPKAPRITVGNIVKIGGKYKCRGTVRYIGVPAFKRLQGGNWYGIELHKKLGQSNGTINGRAYFECKADFGIFVESKLISLCKETHGKHSNDNDNDTDNEQQNDEDEEVEEKKSTSSSSSSSKMSSSGFRRKKHGITVQNVTSTSLTLMKPSGGRARSRTIDNDKTAAGTSRPNKKRAAKKRKAHHSTDFGKHKEKLTDMFSVGSIPEDEEQDEHKNDENAENNGSEQKKEYDKVFIIHSFGYPVTFLLSDKKPNIAILKEQIIHTFGHIEVLENEQIYVKNVDKMCLLVRITFHSQRSYEKAREWKFWWKKKSVSMKNHAFKKWKQEIEVKKIYPICFEYPESWKLSQERVKSFLIEHYNNMEDLLQNKGQIQFETNDDRHVVKCIINFANKKARSRVHESQYIDLHHVENLDTDGGDGNNSKYQCKLTIETDCVKL